jgi:glutamate--cysteine ligase
MSVAARNAVPADQPMSEASAQGWIPHTCFSTGPPGQVGIELEHLLTTSRRPSRAVPPALHAALLEDLGRLRLGSRITVEPGGQLELSGPPGSGVAPALASMHTDLDAVRRRADRLGVRLSAAGLDPVRPPRRILTHPRYAAMESHFDRTGPAGRAMMGSTASVQVSVESGAGPDDPDGVLAGRWTVLHVVGPALVAAFANSPLRAGQVTGWASTRQAVWAAIDATRTRPPVARAGESLPAAYARWALDAQLLLVRRPVGAWTAPPGLTFRDWLRHGEAAVPGRPGPTTDDLGYHLTTLFPPVRARGHLEVRYLDALPDPWWQVPVAVIAAVADDAQVTAQALDACAPIADRWLDAARYGVRDAAVRAAAVRVLTAAAGSLARDPSTADAAGLVEAYLARWTLRGRSPGDDLLEAWRRGTAVRPLIEVGGAW